MTAFSAKCINDKITKFISNNKIQENITKLKKIKLLTDNFEEKFKELLTVTSNNFYSDKKISKINNLSKLSTSFKPILNKLKNKLVTSFKPTKNLILRANIPADLNLQRFKPILSKLKIKLQSAGGGNTNRSRIKIKRKTQSKTQSKTLKGGNNQLNLIKRLVIILLSSFVVLLGCSGNTDISGFIFFIQLILSGLIALGLTQYIFDLFKESVMNFIDPIQDIPQFNSEEAEQGVIEPAQQARFEHNGSTNSTGSEPTAIPFDSSSIPLFEGVYQLSLITTVITEEHSALIDGMMEMLMMPELAEQLTNISLTPIIGTTRVRRS